MTAQDGSKTDFDLEELDEVEDFQEDTVLRISDLSLPEPLKFELSNGKKILFSDPSEYSPGQYAKLSKLGKLIQRNTDLLEKSPSDDSLASRLDRYMSEFLRMVLPDLPDSELDTFSYGKKGQIITWWSQHSSFGETDEKKGKSKAGVR